MYRINNMSKLKVFKKFGYGQHNPIVSSKISLLLYFWVTKHTIILNSITAHFVLYKPRTDFWSCNFMSCSSGSSSTRVSFSKTKIIIKCVYTNSRLEVKLLFVFISASTDVLIWWSVGSIVSNKKKNVSKGHQWALERGVGLTAFMIFKNVKEPV